MSGTNDIGGALGRLLANPEWLDYEIDRAIDRLPEPLYMPEGITGGAEVILANPECRADRHDQCEARGWNATTKRVTECPCNCHHPGRFIDNS